MDETQDQRPSAPAPGARLYLLVVDGYSSEVMPLPASGTLSIGRAPESDIPIADPSASRHHAKLVVDQGRVQVADLDSHNGVLVNGEQIAGLRSLHSGDVIRLGNVTLVLHIVESLARRQPLLDAEAFRERLAQELDRLRDRDGDACVLALDLGEGAPPFPQLLPSVSHLLRLMDLASVAPGMAVLGLPELSADEAAAVGASLLELLAPHAPGAKAGLASAPRDGLKVEPLIVAAQEAAGAARAGEVRVAGPDEHRLVLGPRTVLVADSSTRANYDLLRRLAGSDLPILILGEPGVGKENAAWAVHHLSSRRDKPFVVLDCTTLTETLAENVLFGHERGAFTGADRMQVGRFESANGGTLFLDEIGELPLALQPKLLRALEEKTITRVGATRELAIDVRFVAATNRSLSAEVKAGRFRADLFHRIRGAAVELAPLRDRHRELPLLARAFLEAEGEKLGRGPLELSAASMQVMSAYRWEGNVRELRSAMAFAASAAPGSTVEPRHLPPEILAGRGGGPNSAPPASGAPAAPDSPRHTARSFEPIREELRELERQRMVEAIEAAGGVLVRAAALLDMPLRTFMYKLKQYKIERPR